MELPFEKKAPSMADLREKGISFRTKLYEFTNAEDMNHFINDMEFVANNPSKCQILEFNYQTQVDGTPFAVVRFRDDEKIEERKEKRFYIFGKIFTKYEFEELDKIINMHDKTTLMLLGEKHLTMKTGDFFVMLIWATIDKPVKFMEGLDVLRTIFVAKFR